MELRLAFLIKAIMVDSFECSFFLLLAVVLFSSLLLLACNDPVLPRLARLLRRLQGKPSGTQKLGHSQWGQRRMTGLRHALVPTRTRFNW